MDVASPARQLRRCPRCKHSMPLSYFQDPVVICMICYGGIVENEGLTPEELRTKAMKSKWAHRYRKTTKWEDRYRNYMRSPSASREQIEMESDFDQDNCSLCGELFPISEIVRTIGNKARPDCTTVCKPCAEQIRKEEEELEK